MEETNLKTTGEDLLRKVEWGNTLWKVIIVLKTLIIEIFARFKNGTNITSIDYQETSKIRKLKYTFNNNFLKLRKRTFLDLEYFIFY